MKLTPSLVPLGLLLVYSQYEVRNRVMESTARRLEAETATIALDIAGIGEHADASSEFSLRPERVELIASNAGTDFNVYVDNELRISSRPELYAAGLLDTRLNGSAFAAVTLSGRDRQHGRERCVARCLRGSSPHREFQFAPAYRGGDAGPMAT